VAQGVPARLRPRIFLTFRHYRGSRSSAKRTGRLYPRRNPWYSLSEAESTSRHMVLSGEPRKKSPVTPPGIDPGTVRLVAQCLNHYATPGPTSSYYAIKIKAIQRSFSPSPNKVRTLSIYRIHTHAQSETDTHVEKTCRKFVIPSASMTHFIYDILNRKVWITLQQKGFGSNQKSSFLYLSFRASQVYNI